VRELKVAEAALMEELSVAACARQPGADGGLSVAEDPFGGRRVEPFGQRREDHGNLLRRGFHSIQGSIASSTERAAAGRTSKGLDALGLAMRAIAHQSMDGSICDPEVRTLVVGTSEASSRYGLGGSPPAFDLAPGSHRRRGWFRVWRGETTDGAIKWGAGLEETVDQRTSLPCLCRERLKREPAKTPKQRQREEEEEHEQEQEHMNGHTNPRCLK